MKFICFGAGAIGSYVGGSLLLSGNEVVFVERAERIARFKENGIRIEEVSGQVHEISNFEVVGDVADVIHNRAFDAVILAVKSFDTQTLLDSMKDIVDLLPPFISLQNGVENEKILETCLGSEKVIPVSVCTAISRSDSGSIKVEKLRGIGIQDGKSLSRPLFDAFTSAGLKPQLIADGTAMKWSKMISNLLANASSAILDMSPAEIFADADAFDLEVRQIRETIAVMDAYGIPVVNIPGVPVKLLAWGIKYLPKPIQKPVLIKQVGSGRGGKMPSFHIDLYAGNQQNEVEYLNGAVVRFAEQKNILVPVNSGYTKSLTALARKELPLETYRKKPKALKEALLRTVKQ